MRYVWATLIGVVLAVMGTGTVGAQCTTCYSSGIGQYGTFLDTGSSDMRLGISGYNPAYGGPRPLGANGVSYGWYGSSPTLDGGTSGGVYASVIPTSYAAGEWHPQSFYGPSVPAVPGWATILPDGSIMWPRDPQAPSGR
jgi:hypothetical protein